MTTLAIGLAFLLGLVAGFAIGIRGAGRAYDRGREDLLEQQHALKRANVRISAKRAADQHARVIRAIDRAR